MRSLRQTAPALVLLGAAAALACRPDPVVGGLKTPAREIRLGYPETVPLRLEWSPSAPLIEPAGTPTVFVHLLDGRGEVRRTFDHPFPKNWTAGQPVAYDLDLYESALAPPLPKGRYVLTAGLYDPSRRSRWRLDAGAEAGQREYRLAEVEVSEPADPAPLFAFAGAWGPFEPDPSLQILSRRRLLGPASLRFAGASRGVVRLALTVKGEPLPVTSDCGPQPPVKPPPPLSPGFDWIEFDVDPGRPCEIRFEAPSGAPIDSTSTLDIAALRPYGAR